MEGADWSQRPMRRREFIEKVRLQGRSLYRDLPWRFVEDPYAVLVSEVMLQQTQVKRVLRYWERWLRLFPTVDALAAADNATVLEAWQGLGYNRRALSLKRACERCAAEFGGTLPSEVDALLALPGVGPATAAGVRAFAFNRPAVYLETNVRSVFLHELFPDQEGVPDKALLPFIEDACPADDPRMWYYHLLDYGAHLKAEGANPSRRSRQHRVQGAFEGSHREKRSFLLRQVLGAPEGILVEEAGRVLAEFEAQAGREPLDPAAVEALVQELVAEGFFRREDDRLIP